MNTAESVIAYMQKVKSLPKADRDKIVRGIWIAQSLIEHIKKDGFDIPEEVAVAIAMFEREEYRLFSKYLFDWIFVKPYIFANEGDSLPWHWVADQEARLIKSLLCWLIKNREIA